MMITCRLHCASVRSLTLTTILAISALGSSRAVGQSIVTEINAAADRVPEGLSTSDWSSIRAAYQAGRRASLPSAVRTCKARDSLRIRGFDGQIDRA